MSSVLTTSASLGRVSTSGEWIEEGDMPIRSPKCHGHFASCAVSKAYAREAWQLFMDIKKNQTDLLMLEEQDALMAEKGKIVAPEPADAAVSAVDIDAHLNVNEDDD